MAYIEKRRIGDGTLRYRVRVRLKGRPPRTQTFSRLVDARKWARETELDERTSRAMPGGAWRRTVSDAIDRYYDNHLDNLRPQTQRGRRQHLEWWRGRIGDTLLTDLTAALVIEHLDRLRAGEGPSGKPASNATSNRYLAALRRLLSIAQRQWQWIDRNPAQIEQRREPRHRERFLTREEADRLLKECAASRSPILEPLVRLALMTGARQAELLRLQWQDVDLQQRRALIPESKSGHPRMVPLPPPAVEALRGLVRRLDCPYVFGKRGKPQFPRTGWEEARQRAGLDDLRFHDLRHTAASWLLMSGATLKDVQHILGHRTIQTTLRYAHLAEDHALEVADRMAAKWMG